MLTRDELAVLGACVERADEDLANWSPSNHWGAEAEEAASKAAAEQEVAQARLVIERELAALDAPAIDDELRRAIIEEAGDLLPNDDCYIAPDEIDPSHNEGEEVQGTDNPNGWYVTARLYVPNVEYLDEDDRNNDEPFDTYDLECGL